MTQKDKQKIVDLLQVYIKQKGSANKASASLKGVSPAVISHLVNGNWEPYSEDMFRNIGNQIGYNSGDWQFVDTTNATSLLSDLNKAKQQQSVLTILAAAGSGKSEISKKYARETPEAIRIECAGYWDEKHFLQEILQQMGVRNPHNRIPQMMHEIISRLKNYDTPPILIIDEVDKLGDRLLYFLITFYNELKWKCSIVLLSTYYFKKRLEDGYRNRRKGYEELLSRYGAFIDFEQTSAADIALLCQGQGLIDKMAIKTIQKKSNGDLRIAAELIRIFKLEMAYRYHPEIEGLKVNEDGSEVIYCGESLDVRRLKRSERTSDMLYVYFKNKTYSVAKLVCECWHGLADNPRWYATRKEKDKGFHYTNLFWAPCGTNPQARNSKRGTTSKITEADVPAIEKRLKQGETLKSIAKDYNTSDMSISRIKKNMKRE